MQPWLEGLTREELADPWCCYGAWERWAEEKMTDSSFELDGHTYGGECHFDALDTSARTHLYALMVGLAIGEFDRRSWPRTIRDYLRRQAMRPIWWFRRWRWDRQWDRSVAIGKREMAKREGANP